MRRRSADDGRRILEQPSREVAHGTVIPVTDFVVDRDGGGVRRQGDAFVLRQRQVNLVVVGCKQIGDTGPRKLLESPRMPEELMSQGVGEIVNSRALETPPKSRYSGIPAAVCSTLPGCASSWIR